MPRDLTIELAYVAMVGEAVIAGKEAFAAATGWNEINYEVANPNEPLLARVYIPQVTVKKLNATGKIFIEDVTKGEAQILQEAIFEGVTAASNTGPVLCEVRFVPAALTKNPTYQGPRALRISGEPSAESFTVVKASATVVPFVQILNLARQ